MKKVAYYTGFFGVTDNWTCIIPGIFSKTEDCYYFTNNKLIYDRLLGSEWIRIFVDIPIKPNYAESAMDSKELKLCPHRYEVLRPYEYTCWVDSTLYIIEKNVNAVIENLRTTGAEIAMAKHPHNKRYTSVWNEYNEAMGLSKHQESRHKYKNYIEKKLQEGYVHEITTSFFCTGFIFRKNCKRNSLMNESWLLNVHDCGMQCQIVYHFIQQEWRPYIVPIEWHSCFFYNECWKRPVLCVNTEPFIFSDSALCEKIEALEPQSLLSSPSNSQQRTDQNAEPPEGNQGAQREAEPVPGADRVTQG
jgi:hypothetical protein